ncbi:15-hydroxyprostaglandin dehydrogenase [Trichonephila clavipes]|nr:15-hydroxyprostaglandin dehydrogenase [Trichonephila clavipes]
MSSTVLANPTRASQGTIWGRGLAMEEPEKEVGSLEQLLLYADEHYLAEKVPLGDHLLKILHGVEEYHQSNVGPLRFHASQLNWIAFIGYDPRPLHQLCGQCDVEQCEGNCTAHQGASTPVHGYHLFPKQTGILH